MFAREGTQVICIDDNAEMKDARLLRMESKMGQSRFSSPTEAPVRTTASLPVLERALRAYRSMQALLAASDNV